MREGIAALRSLRLEKALRRPGTAYTDLVMQEDPLALTPDEFKEVEIEIKYGGFIKRQMAEVERLGKIERVRIPPDIDYNGVHGLSSEIREKLGRIRPANLGPAARISGVTPAAISILMVFLEKTRRS